MFWADRVAQEIIKSEKFKPFWVDDMFTPSGFAHIGSLRGPLVHDLIYRALIDAKQESTFTYVFNDFDPIDGLPPELQAKFSPYLGFPLKTAPSPEKGFASFAEYFISDFKNVLKNLGVDAKFLSSWEMYHQGKFNNVISTALNNSEKIQDIYQQVSGSKKREKNWLPLQVICEKCSKLGTTRVHNWDGKTVEYTCESKMVTWASGCGYSGKISPFDGHGKLPWKVDWPAHWKVLGVTIEGAGKDHSSSGGSRDIAKELCQKVFQIENPFNLPYEFFLIGGKKMSSSKGLGLKARDLTSLLPANVGRFLFTRTDYKQAIEIDPVATLAIPDLFDEYDRCWQEYNQNGDENLSRAFILSQVGVPPDPVKDLFIPRFRDIANLIQLPNVKLQDKLEQIKGSQLNAIEVSIIQDRLHYIVNWLDNYAPDDYRYQLSNRLFSEINLSENDWSFLNDLASIWQLAEDPEKLHSEIFQLAKNKNLDLKKAFKALYSVLLNKSHGPRAGWLLKKFPKEKVLARLTLNQLPDSKKSESEIVTISRPDLFTINKKVKEAYPSISIGIALIKGVTIEKTNPKLENEKQTLLTHLSKLTTAEISKFSEVVSYRRLYKQMGLDWHSRRPSPEALMRRVILGKGLYSINTCVDSYNLVVMKNRISVGAFDFDKINFPTILRYAGESDEILLLGDDKPTKYSAKELAYYDQQGGYNIDFNFRDAQRTMVTKDTKNIWLNVDGILDITPKQVEQTLQESVDIIVKYCGGKLEFMGMVN